MDNIGWVVVIFSLLGVGILYGISLTAFVEPPYVALDDVEAYEGADIRTKGVVTDLSVTESGYTFMKIRRNKTELLIFVESADKRKDLLNLSYGDEIEVQGTVQLYEGRYNIAATEDTIKKLSSECTVSFVPQIAMQPEEYEGSRISVVGYAGDVYKRVFYLCDERENYRMRVKVEADAGANTGSGCITIYELQTGEKIIVDGVFVYEPENMRYELNMISLMRC